MFYRVLFYGSVCYLQTDVRMRSILSKLNGEVCYIPPDQMHRKS